MRKIFAILVLIPFLLGGCKKSNCTYNGKPLHRGSNGGCYYVTDQGGKEYVDRSACNCGD